MILVLIFLFSIIRSWFIAMRTNYLYLKFNSSMLSLRGRCGALVEREPVTVLTCTSGRYRSSNRQISETSFRGTSLCIYLSRAYRRTYGYEVCLP